MTDDQTYRAFAEWLKHGWQDVPETEELLLMVRGRFTPEEAAFLTGFPFTETGVDELARLKDSPSSALRSELDLLAEKGALFRRGAGNAVRYRLNDVLFIFMRAAFWPGRADETTQTAAPLANRYYQDLFGQWKNVAHRGIRAVPINKTIEDTRTILPYEDVRQMVDGQNYWAVAQCACRHRKNIDPEAPSCPYPVEVCLHFGDLGRYVVESKLGREITRDEAHAILRKAADAGLVHGVSPWRDRVATICNCCKCCCVWLQSYHLLHHARGMTPSSFIACVNPTLCTGCGQCISRCPMDALSLRESPAAQNPVGCVCEVDLERCIGCGVCAHQCRADAICLGDRKETEEPVVTIGAFTRRFLAEREAAHKTDDADVRGHRSARQAGSGL